MTMMECGFHPKLSECDDSDPTNAGNTEDLDTDTTSTCSEDDSDPYEWSATKKCFRCATKIGIIQGHPALS